MIYLVRHGQTDWNLEKRMQGQTNTLLNENGRKQAKSVSKNISKLKIDRIISSDLLRAKETAEIINEKLGVKITLDKRLREYNYGDLEGVLRNTITQETWDIYDATPEKLNAETKIDVFKRIKSFLNEIDKAQENILLVTHGGVLRMMMYYANNRESFEIKKFNEDYLHKNIDNAEIFELNDFIT